VAALASFPQMAMADAIWETVGRNLWHLRTHGISVPFQDTAIATVAMESGAELWTRDAQFQLIRTVFSQLQLFVEPP
jgi:predicted nucleic acid-binding protein